MTTFATQGIAIGGGGAAKKKKGTTIAATLPSDFYKHYKPPSAPRIVPVREGPSSLVTMAEMSLPDTGSSSGLSSEIGTLEVSATSAGRSAADATSVDDEELAEAKPLHSMSLRTDALAGPKTMPSKGLTSRPGGSGGGGSSTATADSGDAEASDAPIKVGSLTAMDLMKMTPGSALKTRRFASDADAGRGIGGAGSAAVATEDAASKPSDGARKKKKPKTQYAMEEDSESEDESD